MNMDIKIAVIMHKGEVLNARFFDGISNARNYLKFLYPKKKFKEPEENVFVCSNHGTKFQIVELVQPVF